jgi:hypothetical protein
MKQLSVLKRTLEDQKRRNEVTHWSVEQLEVITNHFFVPFMTELYNASQKLTAVYDSVQWLRERGLSRSINSSSSLLDEVQKWHIFLKEKGSYRSKGKQFSLSLKGTSTLVKDLSIIIQLSVRKEFYAINYQLADKALHLCKYTYDEVPSIEQIEHHVDTVMTAIVDDTKQHNAPNQQKSQD